MFDSLGRRYGLRSRGRSLHRAAHPPDVCSASLATVCVTGNWDTYSGETSLYTEVKTPLEYRNVEAITLQEQMQWHLLQLKNPDVPMLQQTNR